MRYGFTSWFLEYWNILLSYQKFGECTKKDTWILQQHTLLEANQASNRKPVSGFVGFRPPEQLHRKCLIIVGWVEVRNPTVKTGLKPTYAKADFSCRHGLEVICF